MNNDENIFGIISLKGLIECMIVCQTAQCKY